MLPIRLLGPALRPTTNSCLFLNRSSKSLHECAIPTVSRPQTRSTNPATISASLSTNLTTTTSISWDQPTTFATTNGYAGAVTRTCCRSSSWITAITTAAAAIPIPISIPASSAKIYASATCLPDFCRTREESSLDPSGNQSATPPRSRRLTGPRQGGCAKPVSEPAAVNADTTTTRANARTRE